MPDSTSPPSFSYPHFAADVTQRLDGGVVKIVREAGEGDSDNVPGHDDTVTVHSLGIMHGGDRQGEKFESSRDAGEPVKFVIGKSKTVVPGVHQAVRSMRKGETSVFFVRSDYGYGSRGCKSLGIPANQHLMYELQLLDYSGVDISPECNGSVLKSVMRKGTGYLYLPIGSQLTVSIRGRHLGRLFDSRIVTFELGVGDEKEVPEGVEQACQRMIPGEVARVIISPSYSFGIDFAKFNLPNSATLNYEIELLNYEKPPEHFEVPPLEKLRQAKLAKQRGAVYFAKGRMKQALNHYENVLNYIEHDPDFSSLDQTEFKEFHCERRQVLLAGRLNCAICYLKLEKFKEAVQQCDLVLQKLDSENVKAFYRRGLAKLELDRLEEAVEDFDAVLHREPDNSSARRQIEVCRMRMRQSEQRQRQLCRSIFASAK